jgi:hypothetical protein
MTIRTGYVACFATEGQFSNEYAVSVETRAGRKLSLFVDKRLVRRNGSGHGLLQVQVVDDGRSTSVLLPTETFEEGSSWADLDVAQPS